ncbi:MAG TPA: D-aminoacyl-tRNA deacylase [Acidobacteriota bacterium]|nr:D-aminoacyl-tRNA deacylase [Acidobacteriota bacterium]
MRAVVQRVAQARVEVEGKTIGKIGEGLLVFVAVEEGDDHTDLDFLARKILQLRIFEDETGKMNLSVQDLGADILVISQFTLMGDTRKGNRPSFSRAARPEAARPLYEALIESLRSRGLKVESGEFQALMDVTLTNRGPVTLIVDSKQAL